MYRCSILFSENGAFEDQTTIKSGTKRESRHQSFERTTLFIIDGRHHFDQFYSDDVSKTIHISLQRAIVSIYSTLCEKSARASFHKLQESYDSELDISKDILLTSCSDDSYPDSVLGQLSIDIYTLTWTVHIDHQSDGTASNPDPGYK